MTHAPRRESCVQTQRDAAHASARAGDMLFADAYVWLVLVSALDVLLTAFILANGGVELNALAAHVINWGGSPAMVVYKFALVVLAIIFCEEVGRRALERGRRLSRALVAIGCVPVVVGAAQLAVALQ